MGGYSGYVPPVYTRQPGYGGFWIRLVALIIDDIVIAIPLFVLGFFFGVAEAIGSGAGSGNQQATGAATTGASLLLDLVAFVIGAGYFIYFWSTGSTLGMRLFNLRVVDANTGTPIGPGRALARYLGFIVSALVCYIGFIWAAFDSRKQGWHDKIANTVVIQG